MFYFFLGSDSVIDLDTPPSSPSRAPARSTTPAKTPANAPAPVNAPAQTAFTVEGLSEDDQLAMALSLSLAQQAKIEPSPPPAVDMPQTSDDVTASKYDDDVTASTHDDDVSASTHDDDVSASKCDDDDDVTQQETSVEEAFKTAHASGLEEEELKSWSKFYCILPSKRRRRPCKS